MIRKAVKDDLLQLCSIEQDLFPNPWPMKEFVYEFEENPFAALYVHHADGIIQGFVDLWIMYEQAQIADIAVAKAYQRKGIAEALLNQAMEEAEKQGCETISLEVRISNLPAVNLYTKLGFITVNRRKHYYEDGEDAWLMVKPLGGVNHDIDTGN